MIYLSPLDRARMQRDVEHLHRLGARATAEAFAEVARRIGGTPAVMGVLAEYAAVTPGQVRATGGERFPARVRAVGGRA